MYLLFILKNYDFPNLNLAKIVCVLKTHIFYLLYLTFNIGQL